jgi:hypothetical protein
MARSNFPVQVHRFENSAPEPAAQSRDSSPPGRVPNFGDWWAARRDRESVT